MYDAATLSNPSDTIVPLVQIEETRRTFPGARIEFELLIETGDVLVGLEHSARAIRCAGLELRSLRACADGRLLCRLLDLNSADLKTLSRDLSGPEARIESWTTTIGA